MLIIFGGLPGTGKTTVAWRLAQQIGGMHLRIDSIEQAIRAAAKSPAPMDETGYRVAYAIAEDNLRLGRIVIADSVNPIKITRDAWRAVGERTNVVTLEVEFSCSDRDEHRRRVESRIPDIAGHAVPTWQDVIAREYHSRDRSCLEIDTARRTTDEALGMIQNAILSTRQNSCRS